MRPQTCCVYILRTADSLHLKTPSCFFPSEYLLTVRAESLGGGGRIGRGQEEENGEKSQVQKLKSVQVPECWL